MTGYSISFDELDGLCRKIAGDSADIAEQAADIGNSGIRRSDFGASHEDVGTRYLEAVHGVVRESLDNLRTACTELSEGLIGAFHRYAETDDSNSVLFRRTAQ